MSTSRTAWLLLTSVAAYSYLFFEQTPGVNFLLFNLLLVSAWLMNRPDLIRNPLWRWMAAGSLFSAACVAWYGNSLALVANLTSLLTLAGYSLQPNASFLAAGIHGAHSILTALGRKAFAQLQNHSPSPARTPVLQHLYTFIWPLAITLVFFLLYRSANANFDSTLQNIDLSFISWPWLFFSFGGFLLLFGTFYPASLPLLSLFDAAAPNQLERQARDYSAQNPLLKLENAKGTFLLAMLNGLLLLVNINDLVYFVLNTHIPAHHTYAQYVHQGVYTLIVTVLMAIGILLYYFRGDQHFYAQNRLLLRLAYAWVIQNSVLLGITAYKNGWYVAEYGLTYKRIGVYVYLLLTGIGLITTLCKLGQQKSVWFLVRTNSWAFYTVLLLSAAINWDSLITQYNLRYARTRDMNYLLSLSDTNLPQLLAQPQPGTPALELTQAMRLENRRLQFRLRLEDQGWQSWTYDDWRVRQALLETTLAPH